tara:strand:+ start:23590 stop:23787 length:198 start_codon:yes stop_codon:yes gene_type:complete
MPKFIKTGEKAGALNLLIEFKSPIFKADNEIRKRKGDIFFNKSADNSLVFKSKPKAKILINSDEK